MNLDWYRTFFQLAKSGSFSQAAKHMYITQPAVSRSIAQLEKNLGCQLFFRTRQGVSLTQQGEILYDNLENAFNYIAAAENAITEVQTLKRGELKFGASDLLFKYFLIPIIRLFKDEYPDIKIRMISDNTATIINKIKRGEIEFGIVNKPVLDKSLEIKTLMKVQDCFVVGPKYKHLTNKKRHIIDLAGYPMLMHNQLTNTRKHLDSYLQKNLISVAPQIESGFSDVLIEFAKNDFGIAFVYKNHVKEELDSGKLYEIQLYEKIEEREISIAWLASVPLSVVSNVFIEKLMNASSINNCL